MAAAAAAGGISAFSQAEAGGASTRGRPDGPVAATSNLNATPDSGPIVCACACKCVCVCVCGPPGGGGRPSRLASFHVRLKAALASVASILSLSTCTKTARVTIKEPPRHPTSLRFCGGPAITTVPLPLCSRDSAACPHNAKTGFGLPATAAERACAWTAVMFAAARLPPAACRCNSQARPSNQRAHTFGRGSARRGCLDRRPAECEPPRSRHGVKA